MPIKKQLGGKEMGGETISVRSQAVIDTLPRIHLNRIERAVRRATAAMLEMQEQAGYWWAELESNVTITAEYIMLHRFLGLDEGKVPRMVADILEKQLDNGGWSIWHGDGGEISASVEAYLALKMAGLSAQDPRLVKAREFILAKGGALKTRVFTRIFLALFGQVSWDGIPLLPVEFMLLPSWSGLSIYEFSSWTRLTVVPLMIIMAKRPVHHLPPEQGVQELFLCADEPFSHHRVAWKRQGAAVGKYLCHPGPDSEDLCLVAPPLAPEFCASASRKVDSGTPRGEWRLGGHSAAHGQLPSGPALPGLRPGARRYAAGP